MADDKTTGRQGSRWAGRREHLMRTGAEAEAQRRVALVREVQRIVDALVTGKTDEAQRRLAKAQTGSIGQQLPWTADGLLLGAVGELAARLASTMVQPPNTRSSEDCSTVLRRNSARKPADD